MASRRYPAHSGYFYPKDPEELKEAIRQSFLHHLGPQRLPSKPSGFSGNIIGVISPHAGYVYSGHVAAHSYLALAEGGAPDVIVVIGPNHHALGAPVAFDENEYWLTPLGEIALDMELMKELTSIEPLFRFDLAAHMYEHSIEVQIPFLQFVFGNEFKLVPISMMLQTPEAARRIANAIVKVKRDHGLRLYLVASSDMSHYVDSKVASKKDALAIEKIKTLDSEGLYSVIIEEDISMCGYGPVMTLMETAKLTGHRRVDVLKYADSGDITGDKSEVVAYLSVAFRS
ncbi:MAG: AmmeMemoRadiSam system protein B [Infirmifilum sp.]|jgi:AmmeMemoRadiSam system protein B|uniref:MEMO1 family protein MA03_00160 n=1 Tax=Infirmifilum uzonense TaxID=1550241 RepID=A0A0F7FH40_9CREN|nr:AmmeMemoRadiSam system protein B [Infirmifilum uzonense]AKG38019.1 MEMO1 family protein [Infirmifilum uzonense]